jgi:hypothetical protein
MRVVKCSDKSVLSDLTSNSVYSVNIKMYQIDLITSVVMVRDVQTDPRTHSNGSCPDTANEFQCQI